MSHYLEANDSVRSAWHLSELAKSETHLQAWTETLFALAFGKSIVVPASYAVDSYAFQQVLLEVQTAYAESRARDPRFWMGRARPILLHLHGARSFGSAAADLFERIGRARTDDKVPPFHSSLFPDFLERVGNADRVLAQLRADGSSDTLTDAFGDDQRGELFASACEWFSGASPSTSRRVIIPNPKASKSLQAHVDALLQTDRLLMRSLPEGDASTLERILSALRELNAEARVDAPFNDRSRLRGDWPWSRDGRSVRDVVGDDDATLVREVIDTLYNRVVVDSIGTTSASFSTAFGSPSSLVGALVAQRFALSAPRDDAHALPAPSDAEAQERSSRTMELQIESRADSARLITAGLGDRSAVETLRAVLEAPKEESWQKSLKAMEAAQRAGDPEGMNQAVSHHSDLLSELLGPGWRTDTARGGRIDIRLLRSPAGLAAAGAGGAVASGTVEILASAHPALLLTYSGISAATGVLGGSWLQRRSASKPRKQLRGAVSEIVQVREASR